MAKEKAKQEKQSILTMDVADLFKKKETPTVQRSKKGMITMSKQTMNLVHIDPSFNFWRVVPVVLVVAIMLVVFVKMGILDPMVERADAYDALAVKQEQYVAAQARLEGYDELVEKYGRDSYGLMNEHEINLVNRMDVLELLEKEIASTAYIQNFAVNNNVLTLNIYGITLDEASNMVNRLERNSLVTKATVNSASANDGVEASIFISINLAKAVEEGK